MFINRAIMFFRPKFLNIIIHFQKQKTANYFISLFLKLFSYTIRPLGIGTADFKKIKDADNFLIDKTMLIHEILEVEVEVFLFPRPRRFGKSLNMSMLKYFFEKTEKSNLHLFQDLQISQYPEILKRKRNR